LKQSEFRKGIYYGVMKMHNADATCGIARAAVVTGDWWNVLVLREVARGRVRFDAIAAELGLSRKLLTERLNALVARGVLRRSLYQRRPTRYEYLLTDAGEALLPVLVALQDWGDRWMPGEGDAAQDEVTPCAAQDEAAPGAGAAGEVTDGGADGDGDGGASAGADPDSVGRARLQGLTGTPLPDVELPGAHGAAEPPAPADARATVLFTFPGGDMTGGQDPAAPAAAGHRLFADAWPELRGAGVAVRGMGLQPPRELAGLAELPASAGVLPYPLLSDHRHQVTAALRLPVLRDADRLRLRPAVLVVDATRRIRHALFPVTDPARAVARTLDLARALAAAGPGPSRP
jgi:DNA-binding HxlR family transcriptional regulator/peroxiredoxin